MSKRSRVDHLIIREVHVLSVEAPTWAVPTLRRHDLPYPISMSPRPIARTPWDIDLVRIVSWWGIMG